MNKRIRKAIRPLFQCDAYKISHRQQYELSGRVTRVYSNYTHRTSRVPGVDRVVHFGLQAAIQRYLMEEWETFFASDVDKVCLAYEKRVAEIIGPNNVGSDHIRQLHGLGYLPLGICSVPEGSSVPLRVPSWTVENTHDDFAWLTNYVETVMSSATWLASTSATTAARYRKVLTAAARATGSDTSFVDWQGHDFSFRGMSSPESAAVSGAAHLLSFNGSDSLCAIDWIERYYGGEFVCGSVAATEHSVMSCGIACGDERTMFERLLDAYPTGILSVVSDTFDLWNVLTNILPSMRDRIMEREGKLVIRPDSGDPEKILCGDPDAPTNSPAWWGVVKLLHQHFGATKSSAGYFELDPHVGTIYGDSITVERAQSITDNLRRQGYASTNIIFGVGSFTYQMVTRDTYGSALKATWAQVDGRGVDLFKNPVTDNGVKKSATGRLAVTADWRLVERAAPEQEVASMLQPLWADGQFLRFDDFATISARVRGEV